MKIPYKFNEAHDEFDECDLTTLEAATNDETLIELNAALKRRKTQRPRPMAKTIILKLKKKKKKRIFRKKMVYWFRIFNFKFECR